MNQNNSPQQEHEPAVRVSGLTKTFGALTAVDNLSLEVYKGEIFGFLGPNGAGKTTAISMICGLLPPTGGDVAIMADNGESVQNKRAIKTRIGICPQENIFWPQLTCLEQLTFMGEMYGMTAKKARAGAGQLLEFLGLTEKTNVLAHTLSGGMKRRLNLCLALVHDPQLIVLDEPEAGLDPQSRILVRDFIKTLALHKTVILTTHNMDEADRLAHRVAIIDHGKLLLLDTPGNLKKSIGTGDILEINLDIHDTPHDRQLLDRLQESLSKHYDRVIVNDALLTVRSKNLIQSVAEITNHIKDQGIKINEIKMRENTLEDVFIHLTGRKLRQ